MCHLVESGDLACLAREQQCLPYEERTILNPSQFQQWCRARQFSGETCDLIARIRFSPPARRVQGRAGNVSGAYPSRKMGVTIQFESHTVELGAIYLMEHDEEVLEYYDQPPSFKLMLSLSMSYPRSQ
jgi:hypothetical protein